MSRELKPETLATIAQKLGLPPSADEPTIVAEVARLQDAAAVRDVDNAIARGAIASSHRQVWINAFAADADGTRSALTSSVARVTVAPASYAAPASAATALVDHAVARLSADVPLSDQEANDCLWRLGARAGLTPPKGSSGYMLSNEDGTPFVSGDRKR